MTKTKPTPKTSALTELAAFLRDKVLAGEMTNEQARAQLLAYVQAGGR
jgi:hypothetical protein